MTVGLAEESTYLSHTGFHEELEHLGVPVPRVPDDSQGW
jgi:hypothetical protein